jgi:sporulation protein YlmC with PRC-barrel domain
MSTAGQNAVPLSGLVDARVQSSDGAYLGIVDELLVDLRTGRIEYLLAIDARGRRRQIRWSAIEVRDGAFVLRAELDNDEPLIDGGRDARRN